MTGLSQQTLIEGAFAVYGALGLASFLLYRGLPDRPAEDEAPRTPLGPSRRNVLGLAALFSLDSFGSGFIVQSLFALWLFQRFGLSLPAAARVLFLDGRLLGLSQLAAPVLARRIGLVNTMVLTHIPASLCVIAAALRAKPAGGLRPADRARAALQHGCAGQDLLRHGHRHPGRAGRGGGGDQRAAQPGLGAQPGAVGLPVQHLRLRLAAGDRRRPEGALRRAAAVAVPEGPAAGRSAKAAALAARAAAWTCGGKVANQAAGDRRSATRLRPASARVVRSQASPRSRFRPSAAASMSGSAQLWPR